MFWSCLPITTAVSCVPYMVDYGKRGSIVKDNVAEIVSEIEFYLKNESEYINQVKKAKEWSQDFTLEKFESACLRTRRDWSLSQIHNDVYMYVRVCEERDAITSKSASCEVAGAACFFVPGCPSCEVLANLDLSNDLLADARDISEASPSKSVSRG